MRINSSVVLSAVDTGSANGEQIDCSKLVAASFQIVFGDTGAAGTFKLQMSNDIDPNKYLANQDGWAVTNWIDIPNATASITSGASAMIYLTQSTFPSTAWIRAVYTRSGGGSSTVVVNMAAMAV
jgi:hypothetical protein